MGKTLIHLTNGFPFDTGENFTEGEIEHLADEFDQVLTIPTAFPSNLGEPRPIPGNVHVFEPGGTNPARRLNGRLAVARHAMSGLVPAIRSSTRLAQLPQEMAFASRTASVYSHASRWLERPDVRPLWEGHEVTVYATWFHLNAAVGLKLRDDFFRGDVRFMVSRAHSYDLYHFRHPRQHLPARETLLSGYDRVLPVSRHGVEYLLERYPHHADKVRLARLGVGAPPIANRPSQRPFTVFSTSTIIPLKRLHLLIDALKLMADSGRAFHWYHLGAPRVGSSERFAERVAEYAREKLPADSFTFLGAIPNKDVPAEYQKRGASVFVNVSEIEGVPVSIMEAMSVGLPVIATDVGGTNDLFADGMFDGLLDSNPSSSVVAEALMRLYDLPAEGFNAWAKASAAAWNESWNANHNYRWFAQGLAQASL